MFPILHHYEASPFSHKVRSILSYKRIAYHAVRVPAVMPKPDLLALTGGYRRVPVLQLANHVYCDTALIARVLERIQPDPTLYPSAASEILAEWADTALFGAAAPLCFQPTRPEVLGELLTVEELGKMLEDRAAMQVDARRRFLPPRAALAHLRAYLQRIESLLAANDYLCGTAPSIADFSVHHCLWFVGMLVPETLEPFEVAARFVARMNAIEPVIPEVLASGEALEICRRASHREGPVSGQFASVAPGADSTSAAVSREPRVGQRVVVRAADYGRDPIEGRFVGSTPHDFAIEREDTRAGTVIVHFPHVGYEVRTQ
jgi:glutathione S-transferase